MAWVKIDDEFFDNPKIVAAGKDARDLYLASLCHANHDLTDGFIPEYQLRRLAVKAEVENLDDCIRRLTTPYRPGSNPLWIACDGGFRVHDYHEYQPSSEVVKSVKEGRSEAGRKGGLKSGAARREANEANTQANGEAKPEATVKQNRKQNTNPSSRIPLPVSLFPSPDKQDGSNEPASGTPNSAEDEVEKVGFEAVKEFQDGYKPVHGKRAEMLPQHATALKTVRKTLGPEKYKQALENFFNCRNPAVFDRVHAVMMFTGDVDLWLNPEAIARRYALPRNGSYRNGNNAKPASPGLTSKFPQAWEQ